MTIVAVNHSLTIQSRINILLCDTESERKSFINFIPVYGHSLSILLLLSTSYWTYKVNFVVCINVNFKFKLVTFLKFLWFVSTSIISKRFNKTLTYNSRGEKHSTNCTNIERSDGTIGGPTICPISNWPACLKF